MHVVKISGVDYSCHTLEMDAEAQKQRLLNSGVSSGSITIVEQESYNPPQS
jgi:hypothetical protein